MNPVIAMSEFAWTVREALEQARAALPDVSFAEQEGIDRDVLVRINTALSSTDFSDAKLITLLVEARKTLPKAWSGYGGCSLVLLDAIDSTLGPDACLSFSKEGWPSWI
jgi:hypothetical protein